jgi:5-methyltetrahydropteroyltriglutamate--homocysteine methyltransferase
VSSGLLTTTVGSFPKPAYLQQARNQHAAGRLSREELAELERRATKEVIALQEELGIDILVDGEMDRGDMVAFFAEQLDGMKLGGLVRSYGNRYYHKPVITGVLGWTAPMTVETWRFARGLTKKPVKGMLTGPYTMVDWSFDEHYDSRRKAVLDMARVVRQEAEELVKAGAGIVQVDEPAASARPMRWRCVGGAGHRDAGIGREDHHPHLLWRLRLRLDQLVSLPVDQLTWRRPTAITTS